ncbi:hypothetical protein ACWCXX_33050 [Streptomyces sp. NPDC001732]
MRGAVAGERHGPQAAGGRRRPAQPGLTLTAYSTPPHTPDHDRLQLLAAWAATEEASPPTGDPARTDRQK